MLEEIKFGLVPLSPRRGFQLEPMSPAAATVLMGGRLGPEETCFYCVSPCRSTRHKCARCQNKTYCSRECQAKDWRGGHEQECIDILPMRSSSATTYGLTPAQRFRAVAPRRATEARWHSTESKLTELYGAQDWRTLLELEKEAVMAARAVHADWPEVAHGIYSMLVDTHSALGDQNKVLELQDLALQMAREVGNVEMEAQTLVDMADFNHFSIKNFGKALELLLASLPLWEKLMNR